MVKEAERTSQRLEWLAAYQQYLGSSIWAEKRRKVIARCRGICEGCGNRRAREVHHLRYPEWPIMPGSMEWQRGEKLWDLVGACEKCHRDVYKDNEKGEE